MEREPVYTAAGAAGAAAPWARTRRAQAWRATAVQALRTHTTMSLRCTGQAVAVQSIRERKAPAGRTQEMAATPEPLALQTEAVAAVAAGKAQVVQAVRDS